MEKIDMNNVITILVEVEEYDCAKCGKFEDCTKCNQYAMKMNRDMDENPDHTVVEFRNPIDFKSMKVEDWIDYDSL